MPSQKSTKTNDSKNISQKTKGTNLKKDTSVDKNITGKNSKSVKEPKSSSKTIEKPTKKSMTKNNAKKTQKTDSKVLAKETQKSTDKDTVKNDKDTVKNDKAVAKKTQKTDTKDTVNKTQKSDSKAVPKKTPPKKITETETDTATEGNNEKTGKKIRSFKVQLPGSEEYKGRFTGSTPYQAANKALSKYFRIEDNPIPSITFSIRESTRGSKHRTYSYEGHRIKLEDPITYSIGEGQEITKHHKNQLKKIKKADLENKE